jgi:hypothetical protein
MAASSAAHFILRATQAISLIMSGLMLGLKVAHVMAVPALWTKLGKWRSVARPLREAADLGTELRESPAQPELTEEEYIEGLRRLQDALASWAAKPAPAGLKAGTKMQAALEKTAQVLAVLINEASSESLTEQPDAPPSSSPQVPSPRFLLSANPTPPRMHDARAPTAPPAPTSAAPHKRRCRHLACACSLRAHTAGAHCTGFLSGSNVPRASTSVSRARTLRRSSACFVRRELQRRTLDHASCTWGTLRRLHPRRAEGCCLTSRRLLRALGFHNPIVCMLSLRLPACY